MKYQESCSQTFHIIEGFRPFLSPLPIAQHLMRRKEKTTAFCASLPHKRGPSQSPHVPDLQSLTCQTGNLGHAYLLLLLCVFHSMVCLHAIKCKAFCKYQVLFGKFIVHYGLHCDLE